MPSAKPVFNVPILKSQFVVTDAIRITGNAANTRVLTSDANGLGIWVNTADLLPNLGPNSVVITDATGNMRSSNVSVLSLENASAVAAAYPGHTHTIGNIDGLASTLNTLTPKGHVHYIANVVDLQDALNLKANTITGGASTITTANLMASRALISTTYGKVTTSDVTATELNYVSGVSSALQTQLDSKQPAGSYALSNHTHLISDVTTLQQALDSKSNISHVHTFANISGLQASLDSKSNVGHQHVITNVVGLQSVLDSKADGTHIHGIADVTNLQSALDQKLSSTGNAVLNGTLTVSSARPSIIGNSYAYFALSGNVAVANVTNSSPIDVSISASSGAIQAAQFISLSDARLKKVGGKLDPSKVNTLFSGLAPKVWKYKDAIEFDGRERFGFVAQDLERAGLDWALTHSSKFIPSIYCLCDSNEFGAYMKENHGLLPGDEVKYFVTQSPTECIGKVTSATTNTFSLDPPPIESQIFVYGPLVHDVKSVDYDALCSAAFVCIADLRRRIEDLEKTK